MRYLVIFSTFCLLASFNSRADHLDSLLTKCQVENPSTQGCIACISEAAEKWDKRLNDVYKRLSNQLDKANRAALKESQLEWIKFRDKERVLIQNSYGKLQGTIYGPMELRYVMDLTKVRALQLEQYLKDIEGSKDGL